ncbi:MAG: S46 family peptidase, partial [Bacteroidota bacterium]
MKNRLRYLVLAFFLSSQFSFADEGMWMPNQLKKKETAMKALGLRIPVEEIYSEENASLKDAVVLFGGGCTGEIISSKGLVLTNHHCGFSQVQSLSTLEHNYVENGYWAKEKNQELRCPGLTVTFTIRIENVTEKVLAEVKPEMGAQEREQKITATIAQLEKSAIKEKWQQAKVKPFYYGNEYYMAVTETFRDIRLVGVPPRSIGRFGGDADNWMWPRFTGDFSLFRIYTDSTNHPVDYSEKNIPYTPKKSFTLCMKGVHEGDFTMVFGFPGKTAEYIPSFGVDLLQNVTDPAKVCIRDQRLSIWRQRMNGNDTIKLKYASKYGTIANYWKKWDGEMQGLRRSNVIAEKEVYQQTFTEWVGQDSKRINEYAGILHEMELFYTEIKPLSKLNEYYTEGILGVEMITLLNNSVRPLQEMAKIDSIPTDSLKAAALRLLKGIPGFFRNYDAKADELIFASILKLYHDNIEEKYQPGIYADLQSKYKNDYQLFAQATFRKSIFTNEKRFSAFLNSFSHRSMKKTAKDPMYHIYQSFADLMKTKASEELSRFNARIASLQTRYMKA